MAASNQLSLADFRQRAAQEGLTPQALRQQLREQPPRAITLAIGGLDSFASAAFLAVSDPQRQLPGLRQQLARGDDFRDSL